MIWKVTSDWPSSFSSSRPYQHTSKYQNPGHTHLQSVKRYSVYRITRWRASRFRGRLLSGFQVTTPMWWPCSSASKRIRQVYSTFAASDTLKTFVRWQVWRRRHYPWVTSLWKFVSTLIKVWREERLSRCIYRCWAPASIKHCPIRWLSSAYCGAGAHPVPNFGGILHQSWGRKNKMCNEAAQRPSNKTHPALPQLHPTCHEWFQQTLPSRWNAY